MRNIVDASKLDLKTTIVSIRRVAKTVKGKPTAIIMKSVKGKGVSYMENKCEWHGQAPKTDLYEVAIADLTAIKESLK